MNLWPFKRESKQDKQHKQIINELKLMAIKVSELTGEVTALKASVVKIWDEQQSKYDALVLQYNAALEQLANQTISDEAQAALDDFKAKLKEFDDTIPDTTA